MKINLRRKRTIVAGSVLVLVLVVVGVGGFFVFRSKDSKQLSVNEIGQAKSPFSLDADATNGWYKGPASERDLALFGKNSGHKSTDKDSTDTHFAIIGYRDDGVSKVDWLSNLDEDDNPSYVRVRGDVLIATLQTTNGPIEYKLRTYRNKLKEGVADPSPYGLNEAEVHGYISYGDGYLRIQGYATPGSLLPEVIQAIKALRLDTEKLTNNLNGRFNESTQSDKCTDRDWEIGNCVRAGQCNPNRDIDYVIDCPIKDYDRKFNLDAR